MARSARVLLPLPLALLALALLGAPAGALSVQPQTLLYDRDGLLTSLEVLDVVQGVPDGGLVQVPALGSGVGPSDTTLLLQGHVDPASDAPLGFALAVVDGESGSTRPFSGLGWLPGASGETPFGDALELPGEPGTAAFTGFFPGGSTSVPFFVSYAEGPSVGDRLLFASALERAGAASADLVGGASSPIPEPSAFTAALLGLGVVGWRLRRLG